MDGRLDPRASSSMEGMSSMCGGSQGENRFELGSAICEADSAALQLLAFICKWQGVLF